WSVGANSSTRTPSAPTCARTVTGPSSSGVTLTVMTCSPVPAADRLKMGRASCVVNGTDAVGAAGAAAAVGTTGVAAFAGAAVASGAVACGASTVGATAGAVEVVAPDWVGAAGPLEAAA